MSFDAPLTAFGNGDAHQPLPDMMPGMSRLVAPPTGSPGYILNQRMGYVQAQDLQPHNSWPMTMPSDTSAHVSLQTGQRLPDVLPVATDMDDLFASILHDCQQSQPTDPILNQPVSRQMHTTLDLNTTQTFSSPANTASASEWQLGNQYAVTNFHRDTIGTNSYADTIEAVRRDSMITDPIDLTIAKRTRPDTTQRDVYRGKNRVAAAKCRQKKKTGELNLEEVHRIASATNTKLKSKVHKLRNELSYLRTQALQHSYCGCRRLQEFNASCAEEVVPRSAVAPSRIG